MSGTIRSIDDYLDSELGDDSFVELVAWLQAEPSHVAQFAYESLVHSLLDDIANERRVQTNALAHAADGEDGSWAFTGSDVTEAAPTASHDGGHPPFGFQFALRWRQAVFGLAVLVLVGSAVGLLGYLAFRPQVAAMLTQTVGCRWERADTAIYDGALLQTGQEIRLADGRAQVTFLSGAQVIVQGPAVFTVDSAGAATLSAGSAAAKVPTQAVGFCIATPAARFVDLGTEFSIRLGSEDAFELQVFDGLVELQLGDAFANAEERPLRISEGTAVKFSAASGQVESIPYDETRRIAMP